MAPASKEAVGWPGISIRQRHLAQLLRSIKGSPRACPAHPAGRASACLQGRCSELHTGNLFCWAAWTLPGNDVRGLDFGLSYDWRVPRVCRAVYSAWLGWSCQGPGGQESPHGYLPMPYPQSTPSPLPPTRCCLGWWLGWAAYCCPRNV